MGLDIYLFDSKQNWKAWDDYELDEDGGIIGYGGDFEEFSTALDPCEWHYPRSGYDLLPLFINGLTIHEAHNTIGNFIEIYNKNGCLFSIEKDLLERNPIERNRKITQKDYDQSYKTLLIFYKFLDLKICEDEEIYGVFGTSY